MSADSLSEYSQQEEALKALRAASKYKTDAEIAKAQVRGLTAELQTLEQQVDLLSNLKAGSVKPPSWLRPKKKAKDTGIVCAVLSDTHFDEIVSPNEIQGRNAYNREIAVQRLRKFFEKIVLLTNDYLTGLNYSGCVLFLGGDIFSGDIHDELTQTNEDTMLGSVLFWTEQISAGIGMLADEFGEVYVPCVVGNHGRRTRKPRDKLRARDNFDWFLAKTLESQWLSDDRVTFDIPDGTDAFVPVHDATYLLTHGDQASGGGGIGGIWPPIMRLVARKRNNNDFTCMVLGHWHQLVMAPSSGFILNGSLKGYDEFASVMNFPCEPPQQALWINVPDKGILWQTPILVCDRKAEGW